MAATEEASFSCYMQRNILLLRRSEEASGQIQKAFSLR